MMSDRRRAPASLVERLDARRLFAGTPAGPLPIGTASVSFTVADLIADTTRDRVYVADATDKSIRVIDTDSAKQVGSISLKGTPIKLALAPGGASLVATLADAAGASDGRVQIVSPTTFKTARVVNVGRQLFAVAVGVGEKLYAETMPLGGYFTGTDLRQFDLVTGKETATLPRGGAGADAVLRTDYRGTSLYERATSEGGGFVQQFDVSDPTTPAYPNKYYCNDSNSADVYLDPDAGRIYTADGGVYGIGAISLKTHKESDWPFGDDGAYGEGVTSYPHAPSVYGLTDDAVVQFRQSDGAKQYRYALPGGMPLARSLVATPNGHLMWFDSTSDKPALGIIGASTLTLGSGGVASVSGTVFRDENLNGKRDADETTDLTAIVYADLNNNGKLDVDDTGFATEPATYFDYLDGLNGKFKLDVPDASGKTFVVRVVGNDKSFQSHGPLLFGTASLAKVTLKAGQQVGDLAFGATYGATIDAYAFVDDNKNGAWDDDERPAGARYYLDLNHDGKLDAGDTVRDDDHGARFVVRPGKYTVRLDDPTGFAATGATSKSKTFRVAADGFAEANFAFDVNRTFDGILFHDDDRDGRRDAGEAAYADVLVWLDLDGDGRRDADEPAATSDVNGAFDVGAAGLVDDAPIRFDAGDAKLKSTAHRSRATLATSGSSVSGTFGLYVPTTLAITAYLDLDRNRKHSKGDRWLAYTIAYVDLDNDGKQDKNEPSAITDTLGQATISDLPAGTYVVRLRTSSKLGKTTGTTLNVTLAAGEQRAISAAVRVG